MAGTLTELAATLLLGGMAFFAAVVAPAVFRVLDAHGAGRFLRALFPRYYAWGLALSLLGLAPALYAGSAAAILLGAVALLFLFARQWLMPRINASRDAGLAGDIAAMTRFRSLHRLSVAVNAAQMLALALLWSWLALG